MKSQIKGFSATSFCTPRPSRMPLGNLSSGLEVQNPCPREISRSPGDVFLDDTSLLSEVYGYILVCDILHCLQFECNGFAEKDKFMKWIDLLGRKFHSLPPPSPSLLLDLNNHQGFAESPRQTQGPKI